MVGDAEFVDCFNANIPLSIRYVNLASNGDTDIVTVRPTISMSVSQMVLFCHFSRSRCLSTGTS